MGRHPMEDAMSFYAIPLPDREPYQQYVEADVVHRDRPEDTVGVVVAAAWPPSEYHSRTRKAMLNGADIWRPDGTVYDGPRTKLGIARPRIIDKGLGDGTLNQGRPYADKSVRLDRPSPSKLDPDFGPDAENQHLWRLKPALIAELYAGRTYEDVRLRPATRPPVYVSANPTPATGGGSLGDISSGPARHDRIPGQQAYSFGGQ